MAVTLRRVPSVTVLALSTGDMSKVSKSPVERYLFAFSSLGLLLHGYSVGSSNVVLSTQCNGDAKLVDEWSSALVAASSVGALAGCLGLIPLGDRLGRRRVIRFSAWCFLVGSVLTACAPCPGGRLGVSRHVTVVLFATGRLLWGLGSSLNYQATSQYVAEVVQQETRGFYLPLISLVIVVGDLLGNWSGFLFESIPEGWRVICALMIPLSVVLLRATTIIPDSPRWLVLRAANTLAEEKAGLGSTFARLSYGLQVPSEQRLSRAKGGYFLSSSSTSGPVSGDDVKVLESLDLQEARGALGIIHCCEPNNIWEIFIRGFPEAIPGARQRAEIENELAEIVQVMQGIVSGDDQRRRPSSWTCSCSPNLRTTTATRAMVVGFALIVLSQLSAGSIIQYFPKHVLEMAGHSHTAATALSVWIAFAKMLATGLVAYALDSVGRRFFLVLGITIQLISSTVLGAMFGMRGWEDYGVMNQLTRRMVDISLFLCLVGYQFGLGPLTWAVIGEVTPLRSRNLIMALASLLNWMLSAVLTLTFSVLQDEPGIRAMFFMYAFVLLISLVFVAMFVPETTGRSLEDVEFVLAKASSLPAAVRVLSLRPRAAPSRSEARWLVSAHRHERTSLF